MTDGQTAPVPDFGTSAPWRSNLQTDDLIKRARGGRRLGAGRKATGSNHRDTLADGGFAELRWFCVRTLFEKEITADIEIRRAGFEVFAPTLWKAAVPARRRGNGARQPALPDRIVPLFPRYLLVRFRRAVDDWRSICKLPGVRCILGPTPELPSPVPDQAVALIRSRCKPNDCIYPDNVELRDAGPVVVVTPGSTARMLDGPLADLSGICQWSDDKRVRLLLSLLGREVVVTVKRTALEVA